MACRDRNGNFWIGTMSRGLFVRLADGRLRQVPLPQQANESIIRDLLTDAEGNVWVAGRRGLYQIRQTAFCVPAAVAALFGYRISALVQDDARGLWFITARGKTHYLPDQAWDLEEIDVPFSVQYAARASHGAVWLAGGNRVGEASAAGVTPLGGIHSPDGSPLSIRNLLATASGALWVATTGGAFRWDGNEFICEYPDAVAALAEDHQGRIYAAKRDGGFVRRDSGQWRELLRGVQRTNQRTIGFCVDEENTLWVAGEGPVLCRWKAGQWFEFPADRRVLPRTVLAIALDPYGGLWLATPNQGALRLDRRSLNARAEDGRPEVQFSWFDHGDGLPTAACTYRTGICQTREGNIWVGTAKGAAVIDVAQWQQRQKDLRSPVVNLEAVLINDREITPSRRGDVTDAGTPSAIELRSGHQRIEFRYAAIHLQAPEKNRYRYRLEGLDSEWVEAGIRRSAVYTHLPPGSYRFHVVAANNFGRWNEAGISQALVVLPAWWQTLWFRLSVGLSLLGFLGFSRNLKLRQMRREHDRQAQFTRRVMESQETERQRIARELHDGLGQDLMLIKNTAKVTWRQMEDQSPAKARLNEISDLAGRAINETRAIMSNLRPPELDRLGLTDALEAMMDSLRAGTEASIESHLEPADHLWAPDQEIHVYRIVQECMNNASKHAAATRIELRLQRSDFKVNISITDNGRGFTPEHVPPAQAGRGLGLAGVRERVRFLGGSVTFESAPGAGTQVQIRLPNSHEKTS